MLNEATAGNDSGIAESKIQEGPDWHPGFSIS